MGGAVPDSAAGQGWDTEQGAAQTLPVGVPPTWNLHAPDSGQLSRKESGHGPQTVGRMQVPRKQKSVAGQPPPPAPPRPPAPPPLMHALGAPPVPP
jgi:hypothetical protein